MAGKNLLGNPETTGRGSNPATRPLPTDLPSIILSSNQAKRNILRFSSWGRPYLPSESLRQEREDRDQRFLLSLLFLNNQLKINILKSKFRLAKFLSPSLRNEDLETK